MVEWETVLVSLVSVAVGAFLAEMREWSAAARDRRRWARQKRADVLDRALQATAAVVPRHLDGYFEWQRELHSVRPLVWVYCGNETGNHFANIAEGMLDLADRLREHDKIPELLEEVTSTANAYLLALARQSLGIRRSGGSVKAAKKDFERAIAT